MWICHMFEHPRVYLLPDDYIYIYTHLWFLMYIYLFVYLSFYLSIYLSIYLILFIYPILSHLILSYHMLSYLILAYLSTRLSIMHIMIDMVNEIFRQQQEHVYWPSKVSILLDTTLNNGWLMVIWLGAWWFKHQQMRRSDMMLLMLWIYRYRTVFFPHGVWHIHNLGFLPQPLKLISAEDCLCIERGKPHQWLATSTMVHVFCWLLGNCYLGYTIPRSS